MGARRMRVGAAGTSCTLGSLLPAPCGNEESRRARVVVEAQAGGSLAVTGPVVGHPPPAQPPMPPPSLRMNFRPSLAFWYQSPAVVQVGSAAPRAQTPACATPQPGLHPQAVPGTGAPPRSTAPVVVTTAAPGTCLPSTAAAPTKERRYRSSPRVTSPVVAGAAVASPSASAFAGGAARVPDTRDGTPSLEATKGGPAPGTPCGGGEEGAAALPSRASVRVGCKRKHGADVGGEAAPASGGGEAVKAGVGRGGSPRKRR